MSYWKKHLPTTAVLILTLSLPSSILCSHANAQVTLFDNLDNLIADDFWIDVLGPDRLQAQQFETNNSSILDSVTVQLQRTGPAPTGSVNVELWQDDGSSHPFPVGDANAKIADLGSVPDVTQLPIGTFTDIRFEDLNLQLDPNSPYWVVINYSGLSGLGEGGNSVGWGVAVDDDNVPPEIIPAGYNAYAGTNGAASANLYRDSDPFWIDAPTALGGNAVFFTMAVEAVPEPGSGSLLLLGVVAAVRWRSRCRRCAR